MKSILVVEDNPDIRTNIAEILELSNYQVLVAENGKVGVEKAIMAKPDLIICDIMMPVLDGYGVLHAVQRNDAIRNTPFIFLTAKTERTDFRKGMELGADDYIVKPFDGTELLKAVERRLRKMELIRQDLGPGLEGMGHLLQAASGKNQLAAFTEGRNSNHFKKKQVIYSEGNHPSRLYFIIKGKVKTVKTNEEGKELVTGLSSTGDFLGHVALLEGSAYRDTALAMEDTELAIIPRQDFDELINNNPAIARKFIQLLARNISEKEEQLLGLAYNSLRKKVADCLLLLKNKYQEKKDDNYIINISRESLATIAGTATESLIRTLSDFRSEKLIDIREGTIHILDEKKLARLVN